MTLTILELIPGSHRKKRKARCRCECGNEFVTEERYVRNGHTKSCGCRRGLVGRANATHGHTTGGKWSSLYARWASMIQRCTNPKSPRWKDYGGRGITIEDPRWLKFENYLADMGEPPPTMELDRIDNNRGYCKENCRWVTRSDQQKNRRSFKRKVH